LETVDVIASSGTSTSHTRAERHDAGVDLNADLRLVDGGIPFELVENVDLELFIGLVLDSHERFLWA
jgi:hypothetical protein